MSNCRNLQEINSLDPVPVRAHLLDLTPNSLEKPAAVRVSRKTTRSLRQDLLVCNGKPENSRASTQFECEVGDRLLLVRMEGESGLELEFVLVESVLIVEGVALALGDPV